MDKKKSILVVDDQKDMVEIIEFSLKELNIPFTFHISSCFDGQAAKDKLMLEKFDLVLMDYQMPALAGDEVLAVVRKKEGPNKETPFIFISGFMEKLDLSPSENFEKVHFLDKPFEEEKLQRLATILLAAS